MGLSKRERMIVFLTIVAVGALAADRLVRAPLTTRLGELKNERDLAVAQVTKAKNLFARRDSKALRSASLWNDAGAESQVAKALDKWSQDAGLMLSSVHPERTAGNKGLKEIIFIVAGKGSLDAVAWFLYQVETSELPIKVKYLQLGSTSEAGDNMSLELRLSALYLAADEKSSPKQPQPKQPEKTNEEQLL
jgi:hypothetical protein